MTYYAIHWFLKDCGSVGLTRKVLTAYNTGKAISYFQYDWLKEVFYSPINKQHVCYYLRAKGTPCNLVNDTPHIVWVKIKWTKQRCSPSYLSCVQGKQDNAKIIVILIFTIIMLLRIDTLLLIHAKNVSG